MRVSITNQTKPACVIGLSPKVLLGFVKKTVRVLITKLKTYYVDVKLLLPIGSTQSNGRTRSFSTVLCGDSLRLNLSYVPVT